MLPKLSADIIDLFPQRKFDELLEAFLDQVLVELGLCWVLEISGDHLVEEVESLRNERLFPLLVCP
jgi:hypothetical protein